MPLKVLILENDITFANDLAQNLRSLGVETTVVEDPNQGLQLATTDRPNLIVLAVELHKMNGFSVCSRLKKEASLASVPVVLVTANSTDVTIEQHRQRPNHADDYVRKPVAIAALLERLRKFIPITPPGRQSAPPSDDDIVIDDEAIEIESRRAPSARTRSGLIPADSDVSTLTDNAFNGIMLGAASSVPPRAGATSSVAPRAGAAPSAAPRPGDTMRASVPDVRGRATPSDVVPSSTPSVVPASSPSHTEALRVRSRMLEDALEEAKARISELESVDFSAKDAELETLRRELDDAKARLMVAGRGGTPSGSTAREVLDLREQLHKKEKDLLDLRDRLTQREKELLNLKDTVLGAEREKADLSDRFSEVARQLTETQRHAEAARSDKEAAAKRAEDAKRRVDKLTQQLEEKAQELDLQRETFEAAALAHAGEKERLHHELKATEERAAEELRSAMARASAEINQQAEKAQKQLEQAVTLTEQRGTEQLEQALAEAWRKSERQLEQALADARGAADHRLERELDELRRELGEDKAAALTALERELSHRLHQKHNSDLEQLKNAHTLELNRLSKEHDVALGTLHAEMDAALARADSERRQLEREQKERLASVQQNLDATRQELTNAQDRITLLEREGERARAKWSEDRGNIERAKDALAAALVQLEAIEQRPLEGR